MKSILETVFVPLKGTCLAPRYITWHRIGTQYTFGECIIPLLVEHVQMYKTLCLPIFVPLFLPHSGRFSYWTSSSLLKSTWKTFTYFFAYFFFNLQSYEFLPLQGPEGLHFSSICLLLDLVTTISFYTAQGKEPWQHIFLSATGPLHTVSIHVLIK